jgi:hypothetical protein
MEFDQNFLKATKSFERILEGLFMANSPSAPKTPPWEMVLEIDGEPIPFDELPFMEFTRRSKERLAALKEKHEYKVYCTPGNARKLKDALNYDKFKEVISKIGFPGLKMPASLCLILAGSR